MEGSISAQTVSLKARNDHTEFIALLITNSVLFGILALILILTMALLIARRHQQPLRKRSPRLIILSTAGNTLFCLLMMIQSISFYACLSNTKDTEGQPQW